ncbi:MAG: hypothetical protein LBQ09_10940 [Acidobacteriaceae bacterium]|nr:hypothetical protein [Acidobacteriaceae bacterium]
MTSEIQHDAKDCSQFFARLQGIADVLAIKLYRLRLDEAPLVPILPCLDHEAMLHEGIAPHAAAYVRDREGHLHEVVYIPHDHRINLDIVSTLHESTPESRDRFRATLDTRFPDETVVANGISWLKGERRVANACQAQVSLRDVLTGSDLERTEAAVTRLQIISGLMEKESRVASWGARTIMTPFLALAFMLVLWSIGGTAHPGWLLTGRYLVTIGGLFFLYSGLKAVHLTEIASRVWKRSQEYGLILSERRRIAKRQG